MIEQKDSIQVRHVACMVPSVIVNIQHTRALATFLRNFGFSDAVLQ
jgi:hypothetical protein